MKFLCSRNREAALVLFNFGRREDFQVGTFKWGVYFTDSSM